MIERLLAHGSSERDRDVVRLVALDRSTSEIASALGVTEAAARKRVYRARRRLAELLDGAQDGDGAA